MSHKSKNLFIVADDLGLSKGVNDAIILGLQEGFIDRASLMVCGDAFEDAISQVKKNNLESRIGLHFVLVEEKSISQLSLIPSLVDKSGFFPKNHRQFFYKYILGFINIREIKIELKAQIEKCLKSGVKPSFINSHQHLHLLPGIMDVVIKIAKFYKIEKIRLVNEPFSIWIKPFRNLQLSILRILSWHGYRKIKTSGLKTNNLFVGFLNAGDIKIDDLKLSQTLAKSNPNKIVELNCHPGFEDDQMRARYASWGDYHWQQEFELLKNCR